MTNAHDLLRTYRIEHELSCKDMAGLLGIAEPTVRSLENGNRPITPERARDMEDKTTKAHAAGKVKRALTRWQLMPEFFGPPPSGRSKAAA